ncbi:TonB-dependent receptor [Sphingopyxis terrae]|uniref:TonB-dependent receptor n=1 Tax=Sphingopyxis terrae TaxID=33052 RepID=UPI002A0F593C|nr:TonB-dependent receptor [Sphingopyxis terrae]MDX8356476.1 TonB-dependent receptor [Sphingopyxis terrae]
MAKSFLYSSTILVSAALSMHTQAMAQTAPSSATVSAMPSADADASSAGDEAPRAAEPSDPNDIVVTASRRAQSLQDVPMSITAVSGQTLENKVATTFFDYAASIPNLSFAVAGVGPSSGRSIAVRGISDVNTTGFYIDDSPLSESLDPKILDVERIEVLRGPQGTLYGARSLGGTVRLITIQPDASEVSGRFHAALSTTHNTDRPNYQIDGAINLPIVQDRIGVRLVGLHQRDAGYFTRTFDVAGGGTRTLRNIGQSRTDGFSAAAVIKLTDNLSVTPRILYQNSRLNGYQLADVPVNNASTTPNVLVVRSLDQRRGSDVPESTTDRWLLGTVDVKLSTSYGSFTSATTLFRRRARDVEDQTDFIASAFGLPEAIPTSLDVRSPVNSFSQELRFASAFKGPVQIVAGLFYSNTRSNQMSPPNIIPGIDAATGGALGTDFIYSKDWPTRQKDYAAYGEVNWEFLPSLTAIVGARVFKNETTSSITGRGVVYGGFDQRPEQTLKESGVTPKFSLQYEFSRGNQVYATVAKGFRPGGPNQLFPEIFGCTTDLAAVGLTPDQAAFFKSDSVWSYEAGAKATMFDRRLRASIAGFRIDWNNIQQKVQLQCGFDFKNNSGTARSQGVELEISANPFEGMTISAGGGYVDAKFTGLSGGSKFKAGDRVPQVPKWNFNLNADYRRDLGSSLEGFVHWDYAYVGSSNSSINANVNPATGRLVPRIRPSYEIMNARIGVMIDRRYELAVFAKNLTDERASLSDITAAAVEAPGRTRVTINQPRTFGAEIRYSF